MSSVAVGPSSSSTPAESALREILDEIAVPDAVLAEAKTRRNLVLEIASRHDAARQPYVSGSVAHGTTNKPLEDADCGVVVNRRFDAFRRFGPDATEGAYGPRDFVRLFADFLLPEVREHYPDAEIDLSGKRSIKVEFHEPVEIDEWGPVDPYVDFIVGLAMAEADGLWIPNLHEDTWDPGDPILHTELMTERDERDLRVLRARLLRLAKRAVKRDGAVEGGSVVMCSWNLSALALAGVKQSSQLSNGLAEFFSYASTEIARALTDDPSPVITEPIKLPSGITNDAASRRLGEMAAIVEMANSQLSIAGARNALAQLFGPEIQAVSAREGSRLENAIRSGDAGAVAGVIGSAVAPKPTRSYGE